MNTQRFLSTSISFMAAIFASSALSQVELHTIDSIPDIITETRDSVIYTDPADDMTDYVMLQEVVVKPKKQKYSKKNNPAVDLLERVRATMKLNDPRKEDYYNVDKYERTTVALNNVDTVGLSGHKGDFAFVANYVDTAAFTRKPIINLMVKEKMSRQLWRKNPKAQKTVTYGLRSEGIDENFNQDNIKKVFEDILREIDIYDNDITLLQNRFVGPLANIASDYYKYYITDTVTMDGSKFIELSFVPHSAESFGFNGKLYVAADDPSCFIRKVKMQVPKGINLNYVKNVFVEQTFERDALGNRLKTSDDMVVEFQLIPGTPEIYARRLTLASEPSYAPDKEYSRNYDFAADETILASAYLHDDDFWDLNRKDRLSEKESRIGSFMENLHKSKLYYWGERALRVITFGYFTTGKNSKFDIGPINTMVSYNDVEGVRLRLGGYTTANLSPHFFMRGYAAYGLRDKVWKYSGELEYSFNRKKYHSREFPVHSVLLNHTYDLDMLGQHYLFTNPDNLFLSLKRKQSNLVTYRHLTTADYLLEMENNLSFNVQLRHERQEATHWVTFIDGEGNVYRHYDQSAVKFSIRYAPGEKFYQGKSMRIPINMDAWIFQLTHEYGPKGMLGADFTFNKTEFSMQKRLWFSAFGYLDMIFRAGKVWSQVQFPALTWANANLSYTIQPESFVLMNPMEFATDQYASWDLTYWLNGLLFNRIPWFKKAKMREVVSFRGIYGSLTSKNNPAFNPQLFRFPKDCHVGTLDKGPYMEIGVGIDNIFKILRLDYVWRLSYLDTPGVDKSGLRLALHLSF